MVRAVPTEVADGVLHLPLTPRNGVNAYLLGDVLVDAGLKANGKKVVKAFAGKAISAHTLTHAHLDHAGGSKHVVDTLGVPMWVGAGDAEAVRTGTPVANKVLTRLGSFPAVPVDRELREGDALGDTGFVVLDTPGHSPGHLSFWRESDRTLVCGDVIFNMNIFTTVPGIHQPLGLPTVDPALNRESIKKIAALEPALALVGHGPPLRDPKALSAFAAKL